MKVKTFFTAGLKGDVLALLAGAMLTLAFAPFQLFPLAILSPALLLGVWLYVGPSRAFFRGWLYGLGLFGTGIYWVFISIHTFGDAPIFLSAFITIGLINILALFPALNGYLLNRFFHKNNYPKLLLAFPAYWVFLEWCRSWLFTGFPWLSLGYSQTDSWLRGYAPVLGIYSISLLLALSAALLVDSILQSKFRKNMLVLIAFWCIGGTLTLIPWTKPFQTPVQVSLVQGDIPQEIKWSPTELKPTLDRYQALTANHWDSQIIVWPEGAIPLPMQNISGFVDDLDVAAKTHQTTLITGIPINVAGDNKFYNAVIALGKTRGVYLKRRLVPFGEYTPFEKILRKLLTSLNIPMSDFIPGPRITEPLTAGNIKIAAFICYEIAFPEQVLGISKDTNMLLTVSDDAWFGHSIAQAQHLQIARMRALELARPVLFASNNGLTAVIDAKGTIIAIAPPFEPYVLTTTVQPRSGTTLWQSSGMDPILVIITIMLVLAIKRKRDYE